MRGISRVIVPVIRDLAGGAEFLAAQHLQTAVWGRDDVPDPHDLMMVIQSEGGLAAGAFVGAELVGYVFAFPTRDPAVQHSHRLAVLPKMRRTGLGAALKWYQRDWCLARGIGLVRWTFDPLRVANAALNIATLGAVSNTYYPNYYGWMPGINAGTPSDRLLVEWRLAQRNDRTPTRFVTIPENFETLLERDPDRAMAERLRVRDEMQSAFADGLEVRGFDRARCRYLLAQL